MVLTCFGRDQSRDIAPALSRRREVPRTGQGKALRGVQRVGFKIEKNIRDEEQDIPRGWGPRPGLI
jgi:hypothetical protein